MRKPNSEIYNRWSPFDQAGPHQQCWDAVRELDRDRGFTIGLNHVALAGKDGFILAMKLKNLVRMPADAAYLRSYSARGEAHAEAVVCAITSNDDGFWQIACEIHERYPDNSSLKAKLGSAIGGFGSGFFDVSA